MTEPKISLDVAALSHVGMVRSSNQDSLCALSGSQSPPGLDALLAVADGMGGHRAGDVASDMAVRGLVDRVSRLERGAGAADLADAVRRVNADVHAAAQRPETLGMGTTLTAAALRGRSLALAHVGDSRAYVLRRGELRQMTRDHSWVADRVAQGLLSPAQAEGHPWSNILTRAVGIEPRVQVDFSVETVRDRDVLLLCSDGLHGMVGDDDIARLLAAGDARAACRALVDLANANGGIDNVAVVVARVVGPAHPPC